MKLIHPSLLALACFLHSPTFTGAQGPLAPPGAPAPTMKTLDQIEARTPISSLPFTINLSGSYYVTANLIAAAGQTAITVNTGNVTIDLNGFQLLGSGGATAHGVRIATGASSITVRNGIVRGFSGDGISAEASNCTEMRVEGVTATSNGGRGIVMGDSGLATDCLARSNTGDGIVGGSACRVAACSATNNAGANGGVVLGARAIITDVTATQNGDGIRAGANSLVTRCTAAANTGAGISCGGGTIVQACAANLNSGVAILVGVGSAVGDCAVDGNLGISGISVGNSSAVTGCVVRGSSSNSSISQGIATGTDCKVSECTVQGTTSTASTSTSSTGIGISVGGNSVVERCTVNDSRGDGIRAGASCRIVGNYVSTSGTTSGADGAGIHTTGTNVLIDGNSVASAVRGIDVDGTGGTIVRNRVQAASVANYDIIANNNYGAIVVPAIGGVVSGSGAVASSLGSTDPWANISQ